MYSNKLTKSDDTNIEKLAVKFQDGSFQLGYIFPDNTTSLLRWDDNSLYNDYFDGKNWSNRWTMRKAKYAYSDYKYLNDALLVDLNDRYNENNQICVITGESGGVPDGFSWGMRETFFVNPRQVIVRLIGIKHDQNIGEWINCFNFERWTGWKEL